jgi:hypothetical protein
MLNVVMLSVAAPVFFLWINICFNFRYLFYSFVVFNVDQVEKKFQFLHHLFKILIPRVGATTLSITTLSIMTLSNTAQHYDVQLNNK